MDIPYLSLLGVIAVCFSVAFMVWTIWSLEKASRKS
jgi:hypothetical protein